MQTQALGACKIRMIWGSRRPKMTQNRYEEPILPQKASRTHKYAKLNDELRLKQEMNLC